MDLENCYKYLVFLNTECDRYLMDQEITEEEIHQLKIELDRFISEAASSDLPIELKAKIKDLKLQYVYRTSREYGDLLGRFNLGKQRRQRKLMNAVEAFKFEIKGMSLFIKMNYS